MLKKINLLSSGQDTTDTGPSFKSFEELPLELQFYIVGFSNLLSMGQTSKKYYIESRYQLFSKSNARASKGMKGFIPANLNNFHLLELIRTGQEPNLTRWIELFAKKLKSAIPGEKTQKTLSASLLKILPDTKELDNFYKNQVHALDPLIRRLSDEISWGSNGAADAFGKICGQPGLSATLIKGAVAALKERLGDENIGSATPILRDISTQPGLSATLIKGAVAALKEDLNYRDIDSTTQILRGICTQPGLSGAVTELIGKLSDEDSRVRCNTAYALGEICAQPDLSVGLIENAVAPLLRSLSDVKGYARSKVASALGKICAQPGLSATLIENAVKALIVKLSDESAAQALGKIILAQPGLSATLIADAVKALIVKLDDENIDMRNYHAAEALGKICAQPGLSTTLIADAVKALIVRLSVSDEDCEWRSTLAEALGKICAQPGLSTILITDAVKALIVRLSDEEPNVHFSAAQALGKIIRAQPGLSATLIENAVKTLIVKLDDEDFGMRINATDALKWICAQPGISAELIEGAVKALIVKLDDENIDMRNYAADALAMICTQRGLSAEKIETVVYALISRLSDEIPIDPSGAALALGWICEQPNLSARLIEGAVKTLIVKLLDEDAVVRVNAAEVLKTIFAKRGVSAELIESAVKALLRKLDDENFEMRINATEALGNTCAQPGVSAELIEDAVKALIVKLDDVKGVVRLTAAQALGNTCAQPGVSAELIEGVVKALIVKLDDVKGKAAQALGQLWYQAKRKNVIVQALYPYSFSTEKNFVPDAFNTLSVLLLQKDYQRYYRYEALKKELRAQYDKKKQYFLDDTIRRLKTIFGDIDISLLTEGTPEWDDFETLGALHAYSNISVTEKETLQLTGKVEEFFLKFLINPKTVKNIKLYTEQQLMDFYKKSPQMFNALWKELSKSASASTLCPTAFKILDFEESDAGQSICP